ncbi:hypothetical protein EBZ39_04320 [bacterium]|nr:hypothetical protein [bacterium]
MKRPPFSYARLRQCRDKLAERALRPYIDANVAGETLRDICRDVLAELPASVSQPAVFDSIRALAGTRLSRQAAYGLAWRLAGNIETLKAGLPVLPWTRQLEDELVPVCVEGVRPYKRKTTSGYILECRAVGGTPTAMLITPFFSQNSCRAISQTLGFSAPWGAYPYTTAMHFLNLLFFAHVEAERSREQPVFSKVSVSSSMLRDNRGLIEVRTRARPCPEGYEHSCVHCWLGADQCMFATHQRTYVTRFCPACQTDAFFDPRDSGVMCVRCRNTASRQVESAS